MYWIIAGFVFFIAESKFKKRKINISSSPIYAKIGEWILWKFPKEVAAETKNPCGEISLGEPQKCSISPFSYKGQYIKILDFNVNLWHPKEKRRVKIGDIIQVVFDTTTGGVGWYQFEQILENRDYFRLATSEEVLKYMDIERHAAFRVATFTPWDATEPKPKQKYKPVPDSGTKTEDFLMLQDGDTRIRILPRLDSEEFYVVCRQHYLRDGHNPNTIQCDKKMVEGKWTGDCPICDHYASLWKQAETYHSGSDSHRDITDKARVLKPVERYYYNVISSRQTSVSVEDSTPKLMSVGKSLHEQIMATVCNLGDDGDIQSPTSGRDFIIRKETGRFQGFPIYTSQSCAPTELKTPVDDLLEKSYDLTQIAAKWKKTPDQMADALRKFLGTDKNHMRM